LRNHVESKECFLRIHASGIPDFGNRGKPGTQKVIAGEPTDASLWNMVNLPIDQMSRAEKVMAMEALWQDLSREEALVESPAWHGDELAATQQRVASGEEKFVDWETAKKELRKRFE
jgi:hypothetical protein